jgi:hypothetical protein
VDILGGGIQPRADRDEWEARVRSTRARYDAAARAANDADLGSDAYAAAMAAMRNARRDLDELETEQPTP